MNQAPESSAYEQTQTEVLLNSAEGELLQVKQTKPLNKLRKKELEDEIRRLKEHRENLRKIGQDAQQTD